MLFPDFLLVLLPSITYLCLFREKYFYQNKIYFFNMYLGEIFFENSDSDVSQSILIPRYLSEKSRLSFSNRAFFFLSASRFDEEKEKRKWKIIVIIEFKWKVDEGGGG